MGARQKVFTCIYIYIYVRGTFRYNAIKGLWGHFNGSSIAAAISWARVHKMSEPKTAGDTQVHACKAANDKCYHVLNGRAKHAGKEPA